MEKITEKPRIESFDESIILAHGVKKRITKNLINSAGILIGIFLTFAVIVITTTDINVISFQEIASLALDFFLLLFVSYSMYITSTDSGMRSGLKNDIYIDALEKFDKKKSEIINAGIQGKLPEFCRHYIDEELKNSRMDALAMASIEYEDYISKWVSKDRKTIESDMYLSEVQKAAIIKANSIMPIKLTPKMILQRGRGSTHRSPLGTRPETKKKIKLGTKFISSFVITGMMSIIVLDLSEEPSWVIFVSCMIKLLSITMNGVLGYKFGFENIVFDTTNYVSDQTDLMEQALKYFNVQEKATD